MKLIMAKVRVLTVPKKTVFTVLLPNTTSWSQVNQIVRYRYGLLKTSVGTRCYHEWNYVGEDEEEN
jgi:hypothetical protein